MDQALVVKLNQAAIDGIRAAGATTQWITPEGNSWSGAHSWTTVNGPTMLALKDPQNKLIYQMHQYFNRDFSGERDNTACTHGKETLAAATKWLKDNKKLGILGEYAGDESEGCKNAVKGTLEYMVQNKDVWKGAIYWSAGPWWYDSSKNVDYYASMEPPTPQRPEGGRSWKTYIPIIMQYA
jgi:endoglucanase